MTTEEQEYAVLVGPHIRDGREVWALCCAHGTVSTDDVEAAFTPDEVLGVGLLYAATHPHFTAQELSAMVLRELLGQVLRERCSGGCTFRPYAIQRDQDGNVRVLDLDDLT